MFLFPFPQFLKKIRARREFFGIFAWNIVKGGIDDYFEIDGPLSIIRVIKKEEKKALRRNANISISRNKNNSVMFILKN